MDIGLFNGLWSGVSNTLGQGAAEISELTGSADKKRAQDLALKNIQQQTFTQSLAASAQKQKMYLIGAIILMFIVLLIVKARNNG